MSLQKAFLVVSQKVKIATYAKFGMQSLENAMRMKKMLTFKAACPTPEDSEYQNFVTMLGAMALALQNRLISKKKRNI